MARAEPLAPGGNSRPVASGDNPFAEPGDDDRTIIIPRAAMQAAAPAPDDVPDVRAPDDRGSDAGGSGSPGERPAGGLPGGFADLPRTASAPVLAGAAPLLSLLAGLRNLLTVPDPASLRGEAVAAMRRYEQGLRDAHVPIDQIRMSHYALCASLDDVVQNTPWGSVGKWADASLVATFHQEVRSGERFFDLLARLRESPGRFLPVIELMYLCMALGMQGRFRLSPRGPAELDRVREETYLVILRQRGAAEPALSPRWRGAAAPYRPLRWELPVWLAAVVATGIVALAYALISLGLNAVSDRLFAEGLAVPPGRMPTIARQSPPRPLPPQPAPATPGLRDRLAGALAAEVHAGLVAVAGSEGVPVLRLQTAGMFPSGSATISARFLPVLADVAAALHGAGAGGRVQVIGYTDDQPIHTVAFPSNYQLSLARARAAADVLGRTLDPSRIAAEGRADADPIASNATPQGREQNRRIEIVADAGPAGDAAGPGGNGARR